MALANNLKRAREVMLTFKGSNPNKAKDKKGPVSRQPKLLKTKIAPNQKSINTQQAVNSKLNGGGTRY